MIRMNLAVGKLFAVFFLLCLETACRSNSKKEDKFPDKFDKGTIHISCDESFKPVIDAQVAVYESLYPETNLIVHYKPEAECLRDLMVDSIRMVIATRGISEREKNMIVDSLHIGPEQLRIARDLIAVIVNPASKDSFFSMSEIRDLLAGRLKENLIPVFDGVRATSTVRFMLDSVLRGENFGENVVAAQSSVGVIDYVSKTVNAVGFVGFSWIGNKDDTAQLSYMKKVKTVM